MGFVTAWCVPIQIMFYSIKLSALFVKIIGIYVRLYKNRTLAFKKKTQIYNYT